LWWFRSFGFYRKPVFIFFISSACVCVVLTLLKLTKHAAEYTLLNDLKMMQLEVALAYIKFRLCQFDVERIGRTLLNVRDEKDPDW
jgi:hypothetical protein